MLLTAQLEQGELDTKVWTLGERSMTDERSLQFRPYFTLAHLRLLLNLWALVAPAQRDIALGSDGKSSALDF